MSSTDTPAGLSTKSEATTSQNPPPFSQLRLPGTGVVVLALVGMSFALRLWELGERALHHDESLDAWWSWNFRNGDYTGYDPVYHGPLRFYITAGFYEMFGESEAVARLFSALSGTAVVGLPWFLRRELGRAGTMAAAAALAISPTMLYYSRFGREDAQMVFLTLLAMVLGLSYLRSPRVVTATGLTFTLACSFAIKESTYLFALLLVVFMIIIVAAQFDAQNRVDLGIESDASKLNPAFISAALLLASLGLVVAVVIGNASGELFPLIGLYMVGLVAFTIAVALPRLRTRHSRPDFEWPPLMTSIGAIGVRGWAIALTVFAVSWFLFFTVWGAHPGDWASGFTRAIEYWDSQQEVNRGGQPWFYYLYALPIYEWLFVLLAFVGGWRGLRRPTMMSVLMVWFAVGSLILYSYAGERMPWLIAHPLLPILILAGMGVQQLWQHRSRAGMPAVALLLVAGFLFTTGTSLRSSFPNGADSREILSQAGQATPHLTAVLDRFENIDNIVRLETGQPAKIAVGRQDAWPWSWYLRDWHPFDPEQPQLGGLTWFNSIDGPPADADVIVVNRILNWQGPQFDAEGNAVLDEFGQQVITNMSRAVNPSEFPEHQSTLFAMRSWWVPTYNDAGPVGWLRYAGTRELWEQGPNPGFSGVSEVADDEGGGLSDTIVAITDAADLSAHRWLSFTGADGAEVPAPPDPNAFVEPDDGRDGCGSVDQWLFVRAQFAEIEATAYPGPIAEMGPLPCVSDPLSAP